MKTIFLIGFMGAGKSTLGKKLAKAIGYHFIDSDKEISNQEGLTISELFETKGESYFRLKEKTFVDQLNGTENSVIAAGGGLPTYNNLMDKLNEKGITLYLRVKPSTLLLRLKEGQNKRPLIANLNEGQLEAFITEKLLERESTYLQAQLIVDEPDQKIEQLIHLLRLHQKN
jgi:shikimate kinase